MILSKNIPAIKGDILIEISRNSDIKLEYDSHKLQYDRLLNIPMPFNYGTYITGKIQEDGDHLDAVVLGPKLSVGTILSSEDLEPVAIIEYYDQDKKDTKVIFTKAQSAYDKVFLNHCLYDIMVYFNYLYYYKMKPNYVSHVYYSPIFEQKNIFFKFKVEKVTFEVKNLRSLLTELL